MSRLTLLSSALVVAVSWAVLSAPPPEDDEGSAKAASAGEADLQWSAYASEEPVKAFAIVGNTLWFAAQTKVVSMPLGKAKKTDIQYFQKLGNLPAEAATSMTADRSGSVWIGTTEGIAQRAGSQFVNFTAENGLPDATVNALACDRSGRVWAGTNAGAASYDGKSWTVYSSKNGLPGDKVQAIIADDLARVWLGTDKGIACYENGAWKAHTMKNGLSWNATRALGYDPAKKVVWAAVGQEDVNAYDGKQWRVYMSIKQGITSILCDTQSRIWFGSETGVVKFNGEEWITDPGKIGVPMAQVSSMYLDGAGNLWFGTEQGVLKLLNPYPY